MGSPAVALLRPCFRALRAQSHTLGTYLNSGIDPVGLSFVAIGPKRPLERSPRRPRNGIGVGSLEGQVDPLIPPLGYTI